MSVLEITALNMTYTDNISSDALKDINLKVEEKEILAIIGSSGCGKSSLLDCIATLEKPTSGTIKYFDEVITDFNDEEAADFRRSSLGIVGKVDSLISNMTLEENILLPMVLDEGNEKVMHRRLERICKSLGIYSVIKRRINEISEMESKKASIARALIHNPDIILLDEPVRNLNSQEAKEILELLKQVNKIFETAVIISTDSPYPASFADRVVYMKDGRLLEDISKESNHKSFYTKLVNMYAEVEGGNIDDDKFSNI